MFVKVVQGKSGSPEAPEGSFLLSPQDRCGGLDPFFLIRALVEPAKFTPGRDELSRPPAQVTFRPPFHQDLLTLSLSRASG